MEPNDPNCLSLYGVILQHLGKTEIDPELIHKKAIALDPTNYICSQNYGTTLFFAEKYEEALKMDRKAL